MSVSSDLGSLGSALRALAAAPAELLVRDTVVDDQFRIERVIGHGAMGVVYLAHDERLERKIALKVARERSPGALARAAREAVALARLSHPNVVVIHQVGTIEDRAYVAMEYVAGTTARAWCEGKTAREITALYVVVGEGLAAAHAAGLVHRDFKPDNVLVGTDGRARVADFGLARANDAEGLASGISASATATAVAGTPAYMAPEQLVAGPIDARADQFAFCASLWEALHGRRPFDGDTAEALSDAIASGRLQRGARAIPRHIEVALRRGLSVDRDQRWPSLEPLLAELRRDPARRRRNLALALALPVVLGGATLLARTADDPCDAGDEQIADVWSPARAATIRSALAPSGAPAWLISAASSVLSTTDAWAGHWRASYHSVCRAGWSASLRDRGMACLAREEHALSAALEALATPRLDPTRIDDLLAHLPRPESCTDPAYLEADVAPPRDPAIAAKVTEVETQLQRVRAFEVAQQTADARALLATIASRPALDYPPLTAELHLEQAMVARDRDDKTTFPALRDAYFEARAATNRPVAVRAAAETALIELERSQDADAEQWARLAAVEVAGIDDPILQAQTLASLAAVATARNDAANSVELATRGLALVRPIGNQPWLRALLLARAEAYDVLGKYELALADLAEAAASLRAAYGENTPKLSNLEQQRSLVYQHLGKYPEGILAARRAVAIAETTVGPNTSIAVNAYGQLGVAYANVHRLDEALAMLDRSLAGNKVIDGERSYNVASDYNNRCMLLAKMARFEDAVADCAHAIQIWTNVVGKDANEIMIAEVNRGESLGLLGRYDDALAASEHALAIATAEGSTIIGIPLVQRGRAHRHLHHGAAARTDLEKAVKLLEGPDGNAEWLAAGRLELAYLDEASAPATARSLATQARDVLRKLGDDRADDADRFLTRLGART